MGAAVGAAVGLAVGAAVGFAVGAATVGFAVGAAVGLTVGAAVGCAVPTIATGTARPVVGAPFVTAGKPVRFSQALPVSTIIALTTYVAVGSMIPGS